LSHSLSGHWFGCSIPVAHYPHLFLFRLRGPFLNGGEAGQSVGRSAHDSSCVKIHTIHKWRQSVGGGPPYPCLGPLFCQFRLWFSKFVLQNGCTCKQAHLCVTPFFATTGIVVMRLSNFSAVTPFFWAWDTQLYKPPSAPTCLTCPCLDLVLAV